VSRQELYLVAEGAVFRLSGSTYRAERVFGPFAVCVLLEGHHQGSRPGQTVYLPTEGVRVELVDEQGAA
jgi:hypothetical protein